MSIKRMVTKLALAFAAKKGMEALRGAGGVAGLRDQLAGNAASRGGMQGRIGGDRAADAGGLGNILGSLGIGATGGGREAGATGQISPIQGSLGGLFGSLASAFGDRSDIASASADLDQQFDSNDISSEAEGRAIIRAMVHMVRADGTIDADEQAALLNILDDASPDERALLQEALREPVDAHSVAAETPERSRKEVYTAALLLGSTNTAQEAAFLHDLASALQLTGAEVAQLHQAVGKGHRTQTA